MTTPLDITKLTVEGAIFGGTGGVTIVSDMAKKKWALKSWENYNRGVIQSCRLVLHD